MQTIWIPWRSIPLEHRQHYATHAGTYGPVVKSPRFSKDCEPRHGAFLAAGLSIMLLWTKCLNDFRASFAGSKTFKRQELMS